MQSVKARITYSIVCKDASFAHSAGNSAAEALKAILPMRLLLHFGVSSGSSPPFAQMTEQEVYAMVKRHRLTVEWQTSEFWVVASLGSGGGRPWAMARVCVKAWGA